MKRIGLLAGLAALALMALPAVALAQEEADSSRVPDRPLLTLGVADAKGGYIPTTATATIEASQRGCVWEDAQGRLIEKEDTKGAKDDRFGPWLVAPARDGIPAEGWPSCVAYKDVKGTLLVFEGGKPRRAEFTIPAGETSATVTLNAKAGEQVFFFLDYSNDYAAASPKYHDYTAR
ncbi:MAG: hypothetical protein F4X54_07445 [Chloroflexi bacterium]|nr:hypothetical protein [Chloroflexota bacterium]MYB84552.1 hypothetical protein [Chloroflexota bacterium]